MKQISDELYDKLEYLGIIDESGVRGRNFGASDYNEHTISVWSIWLDYPKLSEFKKMMIKYLLREKDSDPEEMDLKKVIHYAEERLRQIQVLQKQGKMPISLEESRRRRLPRRVRREESLGVGSDLEALAELKRKLDNPDLPSDTDEVLRYNMPDRDTIQSPYGTVNLDELSREPDKTSDSEPGYSPSCNPYEA